MAQNQAINKLNQQLAQLNRNFSVFFGFVSGRIKNFPRITLGEQISYSAIGLGFLLVVISIVLFIV